MNIFVKTDCRNDGIHECGMWKDREEDIRFETRYDSYDRHATTGTGKMIYQDRRCKSCNIIDSIMIKSRKL